MNSMIGMKRGMPASLSEFGINSREYSQLRQDPGYKVGMMPAGSNSQLRTGIRSAMPEKYEETPYTKAKMDLTQSTIKCLRTPDIR